MSVVSRVLNRWAETTSIGGPGDFVRKPSVLWKIFWGVAMAIMLALTAFLIRNLFIDYFGGRSVINVRRQVTISGRERSKDFDRLLYCSDDWLNMTAVVSRKIHRRTLLFALSLVQQRTFRDPLVGPLNHLLKRQLHVSPEENYQSFVENDTQSTDEELIMLTKGKHPFSLESFKDSLKTMGHDTLEQFLFSLANRFDQVAGQDARSVICEQINDRNHRLKHLGFVIRKQRVCQELSIAEHLDDLMARSRVEQNLRRKKRLISFCIYHDRKDFIGLANRFLSFYNGHIAGLEKEDFNAEVQTYEQFDMANDYYMSSGYRVQTEVTDSSDKPRHECEYTNTDQSKFPSFVDFDGYCKSNCYNLEMSKTDVCVPILEEEGRYCQRCTEFYMVNMSSAGVLPCQKYFFDFVMQDVYSLYKVEIAGVSQCMARCKKPCKTYEYQLSKLRLAVITPLPKVVTDKLPSRTDAAYWERFILPYEESDGALYFEDHIELYLPDVYNLNYEVAFYSFESLMGQFGGILGLFLGVSWMSFIHCFVYICCCEFECLDRKRKLIGT